MEKRRRFILQASALAALSGRWCDLGAERYPSRVIRIIVPTVGGGIDAEARRIAQLLAKALGQPVIVENRPGASYTIGATLVANAAPDGYTLFAGSNTSISVAPVLMSKLAYHPLKSFEPITQYVRFPAVMVVNPALGVRTVRDLVALAKAKPGKLAYASTGMASLYHLFIEVFCKTAGIQMLHVPYKGSAELLISIMAHDTQLGFAPPTTVIGHINAGKLVALLVTGKKRVQLLKDVPTARETGFAEIEHDAWNGLLAPAGTTKDIVARLNAELEVILRMPELRAHYHSTGGEAVGGSPEEFRDFIAAELARMERIVKLTGVKMEQ